MGLSWEYGKINLDHGAHLDITQALYNIDH